jgi:hypothetical protein
MDKSFVTRPLTQAYSNELHDYDVFPKVVVSGRETRVTVKPLGWHAAFKAGVSYKVQLCPFDEGNPRDYPRRRNAIFLEASPDAEGCLSFSYEYFGEQEFYIRISDAGEFQIQLCLYVIKEDLAGRYPFRGDTHMHSRRSDGNQAPEIVAADYRKTGYDFIAITDHRRYYPSLDAIAAYKDVPIEFTLIPGEEVQLPMDPGHDRINDIHIISFGGEYSINALIDTSLHVQEAGTDPSRRAIIPNPPPVRSQERHWEEVEEYAKTLDIPEGIETYTYASCHWIFNEIRKAKGLGIFVHPFWIANVFHVPPQFVDYMMETCPFDAYEVLGGENYFEQNGFQTIQYYEDRAKGRNYPIVGSSDSHSSFNNRNSHIASTMVFSPENDRCSLIRSIKDFYSVAIDTISGEPRFVGDLRLVRYACFLYKEYFPLHDELCFEEGRAMKDYVCGVKGAGEILKALSGRMKTWREKYFAFN